MSTMFRSLRFFNYRIWFVGAVVCPFLDFFERGTKEWTPLILRMMTQKVDSQTINNFYTKREMRLEGGSGGCRHLAVWAPRLLG